MPTGMQAKAVVVTVAAVATMCLVVAAQTNITDADLDAASRGRVVRLGALSAGGSVETLPLETYVARVLAGEAEPRAADGANQALAVAIRTFALANVGRHAREGFDLCDTTHCQVPRAATAVTRRAALATSAQVLTYNGRIAEVFYSASCGGRSEDASALWPGSNYPYLQSTRDDVHEQDEPWTLDLTLEEIRRALGRAGFDGQRLRDVRIDGRNESGRVSRLRLAGMQPDVVAGDQFRAAVGAAVLRSTAFSIERRGEAVRFTGRGFGHGVGMCVIGAGRRAARGEDVRAILAQYFPGLALVTLDALTSSPAAPPSTDAAVKALAPTAVPHEVLVRVPLGSGVTADDLERLAVTAHAELSPVLGTSATPFTIQLHESLESFRLATGKPWWVSALAEGTTIELAPATLLAQREGIEAVVRAAVAELLVAGPLAGRPAWVRVGAARYFARLPAAARPSIPRNVRCPADAEVTLAISVTAQRDANARAEACFARALAASGDWRGVGRR